MSQFIQLHALVSYPPANLNRDDLGNPKTAKMGGVDRLRISSQSLKRAWRTSLTFEQMLMGCIGTRTRRLGIKVFEKLMEKDTQNSQLGFSETDAKKWAKKIAEVYGKPRKEKDKELEIEQLVHISPEEEKTLDLFIEKIKKEKREPTDDELKVLLHEQHAVDIAMFGRMLASKTNFNVDAAVQVAHAIGVHASTIEEDYFTAVDDLNKKDPAAAHIGESGFAAAIFYQYICINRELLKTNLNHDEDLVQRSIKALIQSALTVAPSGKQNSYASRAYAHYALVEKGAQQPRSLSLAFVKPIVGDDYANSAITALENIYENMDKVYGQCADARYSFNVMQGKGSLFELLDFVVTEK